jgi:predicted nucleotidyltransferase
MDKERILGILREHEPDLKAAGVLHLHLFGSVARGDNTPASDVDLLFDCDEAKAETLLSLYGLENRITDILGFPVHLSSAKYIRPQIRKRVMREAVLAF